MARKITVELCQKVRELLGCDITDTKRLSKLDEDIWKLNLIKRNANMKIKTICKRKFLGFSQATQSEKEINIDNIVFERIINYYEEEYERQVNVCRELIRKLESN